LNRFHFTGSFKTTLGQPPHQSIRHCRVDRAKRLLLSKEMSIAKIAQNVAFGNQGRLQVLPEDHRFHTGAFSQVPPAVGRITNRKPLSLDFFGTCAQPRILPHRCLFGLSFGLIISTVLV
jgi:AraC-like DNA-binding protein